MEDLPGKVVSIAISNKADLYKSYMFYLQHGGIFVQTKDDFEMGEEVLLAIKFAQMQEPKYLRTKVVWIQGGSSTHHPCGIGVAFDNDKISIEIKNFIEDLVPDFRTNEQLTYTI